MRRSLLAVTMSVPLACAGAAALACPSTDSYAFLILGEPPAATARESIVARVEVVALAGRESGGVHDSRSARVRVIDAVRGTRRGAEFVVGTRRTGMCTQRFGPDGIGQRGHVAGEIDPATGAFRGSWRGGQRIE